MIPLIIGIQLLLIFAVLLLIKEIKKMATRADLNTAIDGLGTLVSTLGTAIAALIAKINAGGDFQSELDKVNALTAGIQALITQATA